MQLFALRYAARHEYLPRYVILSITRRLFLFRRADAWLPSAFSIDAADMLFRLLPIAMPAYGASPDVVFAFFFFFH